MQVELFLERKLSGYFTWNMQFPLVRMRTRHNNIAIVKIFLYIFGWILTLSKVEQVSIH